MNYLDAIKYPKTMHFDFSKSLQNDDRKLESLNGFIDKTVVVSEKMDGENFTAYRNYYHPRSVIDDGHASRDWLKGFLPTFQYKIPDKWRICGENVYAEHSIKYDNLESFCYIFNIWNEDNYCLSYEETLLWCNEFGVKHVPVFYVGDFDYGKIKKIYDNLNFSTQEGIVCRITDKFHYTDFQKYVAKAVRPKHVQTENHWKKTWKPNKLKQNDN